MLPRYYPLTEEELIQDYWAEKIEQKDKESERIFWSMYVMTKENIEKVREEAKRRLDDQSFIPV